jgi:two-component system cell cycle sensor histidine kinase/response regulator CckA
MNPVAVAAAGPGPAALVEYEEFTRLVTEAVHDGVFLVDVNGRLLFANRYGEEMTGYRLEELRGQPLDVLLRPGDISRTQKRLDAVKAGAPPSSYLDVEVVRKDGSTFWAEVNFTTVELDGRVLGRLGVARDVTERREAARALVESERRYRLVAENARDVIWVRDMDLRLVYVSPAVTRLRGYTVEEALAQPMEDMLTPGSLEVTRKAITEATAEGAADADGRLSPPFELEMMRKDGSTVWTEVSASLMRDEDGRPMGILGITRDISERKQTERRLRLLDTVLGAAANAIVITEADGTVTWVNSAFTALTGYSSDEVIGRNASFLHSGVHGPEFYETMWRTIRAGETWRREVTHRRKDGTLYTAELSLAPVFDARRAITHFVAISHDVTERVRATAELRRSQERFAKVFHSSMVAMGLTTGDCGRLLDVNECYAEFFGYRREELVGHTTGELRLWADSGECARLSARLRRGESVKGVEVRFRHRSGKLLDALVSMEILELEGEPVNLVTFTDITERKELEAQFRQAQKMEAIGQLAGGVAHDFNNLLTIIIGRLQLLRQGRPDADPLGQDLRLIEETAFRAAALTRQLLAFSRKQVLETRAIDLNTMVGEMEPLLKRLIGEHIELQIEGRADIGTVMGDPAQLGQVLMNLVVNARDAMTRGGRLCISTERVTLDDAFVTLHPCSGRGTYVMMAVSDTGIGIPPETQAQIFEPFFTTKGVGEGTGLGLSTVYGIVKQHHGCIVVESEVGRGSTFRIYLPQLDQPAPSTRGIAAARPARGTETVLLVEDEPDVRSLVREILQMLGYVVLEANDVDNALRMGKGDDARIDLLLTDVVMPRMSGPELAAQLRTSHPELRVLYVSGYADTSRQLVGAPGTAFLQKPFTPERLATSVRQLLDVATPARDL